MKRQRIHRSHHSGNRSAGTVRQVLLLAVAATVLLTVGVFTFYNYVPRNNPAELGHREIIARNGERVNFKLNDGSRVILHAGSRLEVPLQFNDSDRKLYLEGEAFFEVAHDAARPFTVHSESAEIRVLGTRFLVQAWTDRNQQVDVVVADGKVSFGSDRATAGGARVILTRNQRATLVDGEIAVDESTDMDWYLGWTKGSLFFNNRQLNEIIPKLERWYAIEIETGDNEIGTHSLTAEIDYSQPMSEVLEGIAMVLDLDLEKQDRTFTFKTRQGRNQ